MFPLFPCFPVLTLFAFPPASPVLAPCLLRSLIFPGLFPAFPAPAAAPWPWRSPKFPGLFSPPAPAAPPPAPSVLLNDLIASWFGFPLFVEARRFLSLAAACWRFSCSDVGPTLLALVIAFLCSAFGCAFIPPFPPLKLVRLAFTFLANELLA